MADVTPHGITASDTMLHGREAAVHVAVSGLFLRYPQTGTGRYARRVIEELWRDPRLRTAIVADCATDALDFRPGRITQRAGQQVVRAPEAPLRLNGYGKKLYWEQIALRLAVRRLGVDLLYAPHFSLPLFAGCPTVLSIHDVIPLTEPGYNETIATRLYFRLVGAAARQATAITTLSRYSAGEIARRLHISPARICVIPPGIEDHFHAGNSPDTIARARACLGIPERYLLYLGGADVRKNIGVLLRALALIRDSSEAAGAGSADIPTLVIAAVTPSPAPSAHHPDWRGMATELRVADRVQFVERVPEADLPAIYQGALAFLFPSRAEGFGLTPLEAMACGTPVICSSATSLPEAVGDAALLAPPDDARAWAAAMLRVCGDAGLRDALRDAGIRQARLFRWEDTARRVRDVILEVAQCGS